MKEVLAMRKHSPRKWLHAVLDLMPVLLIPVFMIYSHRHQIDTYSVEIPTYEVVDFNQLMPNDKIHFSYSGNNPAFVDYITLDLVGGHKYAFKFTPNSYPAVPDSSYTFYLYNFSSGQSTIYQLQNNIYSITLDTSCELGYATYSVDNQFYQYEGTINYYDLTVMFGGGNEPTIEEFNSYFPNDYYDYTLSKQVLLEVGTETLNDTDIGSQLMYCMYNSVDKYFNCAKLFGFNNIYTWINLNMFGGSAPLMVYIVYQVIVYEFFMDLIFLIYSIFMFIIDFSEELLSRCFSFSRHGGSR